jgi:hypothetical protein
MRSSKLLSIFLLLEEVVNLQDDENLELSVFTV